MGGVKSHVPTMEDLKDDALFLRVLQQNGSPNAVAARLGESLTGGYS